VEPYEYQTLFECESSYWWYQGLHAVLLDVLKQEGVTSTSRVLDAGCGTGQNLVNIAKCISEHTFGVDLSSHVTPYWRRRGLKRVSLASVNHLPWPDCIFDVVVSTDVLECDEVEEKAAYGELWRVARHDGVIVVVVPAYDWLLTKEHQQAVHASRRYTKNSLLALLQNRPIHLGRITYLFTLLFPAIASYRLSRRLLADGKSEQPRSELRPLPGFLNHTLYRIMLLERLLLRAMNLPFGSSLLAVVRKNIVPQSRFGQV